MELEPKRRGSRLWIAGVVLGILVIGVVVVALVLAPFALTERRIDHQRGCMSNMHSIAIGLQMYQQDNRKYPETIGGYVQTDASGNVIPLERAKQQGSLYPDYLKSVKEFHCPLSETKDTSAVLEVSGDGAAKRYYAYDSYDAFYREAVSAGQSVTAGAEAMRYRTSWADSQASVSHYNAYGKSDTAEIRTKDYERQLKFRMPPSDTVVTWCSYHRDDSPNSMVPVLFLDGHCDSVRAGDIEGADGKGGSRWRTTPKM